MGNGISGLHPGPNSLDQEMASDSWRTSGARSPGVFWAGALPGHPAHSATHPLSA